MELTRRREVRCSPRTWGDPDPTVGYEKFREYSARPWGVPIRARTRAALACIFPHPWDFRVGKMPLVLAP